MVGGCAIREFSDSFWSHRLPRSEGGGSEVANTFVKNDASSDTPIRLLGQASFPPVGSTPKNEEQEKKDVTIPVP